MDSIKIVVKKEFDQMNVKELLKCFNVGKGKIEEIRNNFSIKINKENASLESVVSTKDEVTFFFTEKIDYTPYSLKLSGKSFSNKTVSPTLPILVNI